ncbi:MAG: hypothetical protein Kow0025_22360 [Thermodesulfovibrionales bacterium]
MYALASYSEKPIFMKCSIKLTTTVVNNTPEVRPCQGFEGNFRGFAWSSCWKQGAPLTKMAREDDIKAHGKGRACDWGLKGAWEAVGRGPGPGRLSRGDKLPG